MRGPNAVSAPLFAAAVEALGIDLCESVPVLCDPLPATPPPHRVAGDRGGVASSHRRCRARARAESLRGDGRRRAPPRAADIRLRATPTSEGPTVALAGDASSATEVGVIAPQDAVDAVLALLSVSPPRGWRRALPICCRRVTRTRREPGWSLAREPVGLRPLKGGACAIGLGLAFGHAEAAALKALAELAMDKAPAGRVRRRTARAARASQRGPGDCRGSEAERLGFVTETNDPRRRIVACPGTPACASGLIAARSLAAEIARDVPLVGDGLALHVSGCAKGCAHPAPAPLTIVGTARGCGSSPTTRRA